MIGKLIGIVYFDVAKWMKILMWRHDINHKTFTICRKEGHPISIFKKSTVNYTNVNRFAEVKKTVAKPIRYDVSWKPPLRLIYARDIIFNIYSWWVINYIVLLFANSTV